MCKKLAEWYYEKDVKNAEDIEASGVEIFMFYVSLTVLLIFGLYVVFFGKALEWRYLLTFIPLSIWGFLRCSRKDMRATGNLVAGIFGGIGGSIVWIVAKMLGN